MKKENLKNIPPNSQPIGGSRPVALGQLEVINGNDIRNQLGSLKALNYDLSTLKIKKSDFERFLVEAYHKR